MTLLSKSFLTGAFAVAMAAAALTTSMTTSAEAGRKHFRHAIKHCHTVAPHPYRCFNRVYHRALKRAYRNAYAPAYGLGYVSGYSVYPCGWQTVITKKWNPAHTKLTIIKDRVWTCY
jgi:hypothetical protein